MDSLLWSKVDSSSFTLSKASTTFVLVSSVILPCVVVQIFQLFFFVPYRGEGFPVCDNLHIHRGINGKGKLLLLIVKRFPDGKSSSPQCC